MPLIVLLGAKEAVSQPPRPVAITLVWFQTRCFNYLVNLDLAVDLEHWITQMSKRRSTPYVPMGSCQYCAVRP